MDVEALIVTIDESINHIRVIRDMCVNIKVYIKSIMDI